jgi:hypothetical protein
MKSRRLRSHVVQTDASSETMFSNHSVRRRETVSSLKSTPHNLSRWARTVIEVSKVPYDPRTLIMWSRVVGKSQGALRGLCYLAHQSPKRSLEFGRLLRAVIRAGSDGWQPEDLLDVMDTRTLARFRPHLVSSQDVPDTRSRVAQFIGRQQIITDSRALAEIRAQLLETDFE